MTKRLKPSEVTAENADQAFHQMIDDMWKIVTRYRRTHEMLVALWQNTGDDKYKEPIAQVGRTISNLESEIDQILRKRNAKS